MVTGYNFNSLVKSINQELQKIEINSNQVLNKQAFSDIYNKMSGLIGYKFDRKLTQSSFTFYNDSNSNGIWQFHIPDLSPNTYTFLYDQNTVYKYLGNFSQSSILDAINTAEASYNSVFLTSGQTVYLTVKNSGMTMTLYQDWINDQATLTGIETYFENNQLYTTYHVNSSSTLSIEIKNVETQVLTANTFHANQTNDLAEYRITTENILPGYVVENDGENVRICHTDRSKTVVGIVSDTSNMTIGNKNGVPIAISGRVLAYYDGKLNPGDLVCSTKFGTVRKVNFFEKILFPESIIGKVLSIPTYTHWNNVEVKGRQWIQI